MKKIGSLILLICLSAQSLWACYCLDPTLDEARKSQIVFLGVMVERFDSTGVLYTRHSTSYGLALAHFRIIKTQQGIEEHTDRITVFDSETGSTCHGVFHYFELGDTVLVFANAADLDRRRIAHTDMCSRTKSAKDFDSLDIAFLNEQNGWIEPRQYDGSPFPPDNLPTEAKEETRQEVEPNNLLPWLLSPLLAASLALNIFLWKKSRK